MVTMCPDRQIISLYLDGELPSPWKEKMASHMESCPQCRTVFSRYSSLEKTLQAEPESLLKTVQERAQERIWEKLNAPALVIRSTESGTGADKEKNIIRPFERKIWNRGITLPLPVAAAAAAMIIIAFVALVNIRNGSQNQAVPMAAAIGLDDYGTVPIHDMNEVINYLASQDNGDQMVIRLPETRRFSRSGEPALINAADYSRTRSNFR